jgi:hypothetical protein
VLALVSNDGELAGNRGVIIPEVGLQVGCQLTRHIRGWVGCTGLWWSDTITAGRAVDFGVNPGLFPPSNAATGTQRPAAAPFGMSSLWVEGVDAGLEVRY